MPACPLKYQNHPARLEAIARGLDRFACEPCARGHAAPRYCQNGVCITCNAENGARQRRGDKPPRRAGKIAKAANVAAAEHRRAALARLPKAAAMQLAGYDHGFQARRHSKYLDGLLLKIT